MHAAPDIWNTQRLCGLMNVLVQVRLCDHEITSLWSCLSRVECTLQIPAPDCGGGRSEDLSSTCDVALKGHKPYVVFDMRRKSERGVVLGRLLILLVDAICLLLFSRASQDSSG